jgi:hypothetical protein
MIQIVNYQAGKPNHHNILCWMLLESLYQMVRIRNLTLNIVL